MHPYIYAATRTTPHARRHAPATRDGADDGRTPQCECSTTRAHIYAVLFHRTRLDWPHDSRELPACPLITLRAPVYCTVTSSYFVCVSFCLAKKSHFIMCIYIIFCSSAVAARLRPGRRPAAPRAAWCARPTPAAHSALRAVTHASATPMPAPSWQSLRRGERQARAAQLSSPVQARPAQTQQERLRP